MGKDWRENLEEAFQKREPFLGHPLNPIPLVGTPARTERVSTYMELSLLKTLEEYCTRGGFRSVSEVLRRLVIIGLLAEGYDFDGEVPCAELE